MTRRGRGTVNSTGRDIGRWRRRVYGWSWPRTYESTREMKWACERAKRNETVQEPGNDALRMATSQKASWTPSNPPTHKCTENGSQRRKESRFTELKEIERRGRGQIHERMRDLLSLKQATKFSTDLLRFQKKRSTYFK